MTSQCNQGDVFDPNNFQCLGPGPEKDVKEEIIEDENAEFAQNAGYTTTSVIAGGAALSSASLILVGGSSQGLFSAVNMFQILLLFPLFRLFLPTIIMKFYESLDWTLFSFNFISFGQIPVINEV